MKIITIGNSAGGYAATLFGYLLNAERIFSVSGQFVLQNIENEKLLLKHSKENLYSKYYDLRVLLSKYCGDVFYIYPAHSESDILQSKFVHGCKNVFPIKIKSNVHGTGLLSKNYKHILFISNDKIKRKINCIKEYSPFQIALLTIPLLNSISIITEFVIKRIIKKLLFLLCNSYKNS